MYLNFNRVYTYRGTTTKNRHMWRFLVVVLPVGIEPTLPAPQASVLSIKLRERACHCIRNCLLSIYPKVF